MSTTTETETVPEERLISAEPVGENPYGTAALQEPVPFTIEMLERHFMDGEPDDEWVTGTGTLTLRFDHDDHNFWLWSVRRGHYVMLSEHDLKAIVGRLLTGAWETYYDKEEGPSGRLIKVTNRLLNEVLSHLETQTLTSEFGAGALLPATGGVPFRNGWLNVETGVLEPIGPERDIRWAVPADYDETAKCPNWIRFLTSLGWTRDTEEYRLLRQWLGYLLSASVDQQKGILLLGPKRAGKGTILAVCEALLGDGATGTQLDKFTQNFGMQNFIGKGLVTVGDARFGQKVDKALYERLLSLVSADRMTIDVKHGTPLSVRPTVRLMMAMNESPKFREASDALASRFLILKFTRSFYGQEDLDLRRRVLAELPGIARWALGGYRDLMSEGRFTETSAGLAEQAAIVKEGSVARQFVEEMCVLEDDARVERDDLYANFCVWADQGNFYKLNKEHFGRELNTAFGDRIRDVRPRIGGKPVRFKQGVRLRTASDEDE